MHAPVQLGEKIVERQDNVDLGHLLELGNAVNRNTFPNRWLM